MEHVQKKKKVKGRKSTIGSSKYPCRVQMYALPPTDEISLEEFERFALERVKGLKAVENAKLKFSKRGSEYEDAMRKLCKIHFNIRFASDDTLDDELIEERKKDHIAHYILRLAYCRSEDLRRWFLIQETELFRFRFQQLTSQEKTHFMKLNNLEYTSIDNSEKNAIAKQLVSSCHEVTMETLGNEQFFKVPFEEALDLVKQRRVFVQGGYAYIRFEHLVHTICGIFRMKLSSALVTTSRVVPTMEEDDRLLPMLLNLSKQYLGSEYDTKSMVAGKITPSQIDMLAAKCFPLCMRNMHDEFRQKHHLKHGGRMQYGLFLKGIGLSLDDALTFWRSEFTKAMSGDKFDKSYSYNIRHNYGKEGKRADYTPYNCVRIITSNAPGPGDHHGCPFKHFDEVNLRAKLAKYGVPSNAVYEIIGLVKGSHFQVACSKYFEVTQKMENSNMELNHPNQYFLESYKHHFGDAIGGKPDTDMAIAPSTDVGAVEPPLPNTTAPSVSASSSLPVPMDTA
eukprot:Nk52_evm60s352 gene=Nk52_evmTU60s352